MRTVEVRITSDDKSDSGAVGVYTETKRGDIWTRTDAKDVTTNREDGGSFQLRAGQRLVVDAFPGETEVSYDAAQAAAVVDSRQRNGQGRADAPRDDAPDVKEIGRQEQDRRRAEQERGASKSPNPDPLDTNRSMAGAGKEASATPTHIPPADSPTTGNRSDLGNGPKTAPSSKK